jgi:hypothetical protein
MWLKLLLQYYIGIFLWFTKFNSFLFWESLEEVKHSNKKSWWPFDNKLLTWTLLSGKKDQISKEEFVSGKSDKMRTHRYNHEKWCVLICTEMVWRQECALGRHAICNVKTWALHGFAMPLLNDFGQSIN